MYIRLSREDGDKQESESIGNQRKILQRYIKESNLDVIQEYVDDGISGTTFNRPSFNKMIDDIENGTINMVITKDLSRLGRDYIKTGYYLEDYFPKNNVRYVAITDGIDTYIDSTNNDITPFKAIMNDMYAKDISKKIRSVLKEKQKQGEYMCSIPAYGYKRHPSIKNKLIIDEQVKDVVEKIFDMYANSHGSVEIVKFLNSKKYLSPTGYRKTGIVQDENKTGYDWNEVTLCNILKNEVYIGNTVQNKKSVISYKVKKIRTIEKENQIRVDNTHEAIIDKDTFEKVQCIIEKRGTNTKLKYDYLLRGLLYCYHCKRKLQIVLKKNSKRNAKSHPYITCSDAKERGCYPLNMNYEKFEKHIINIVKKICQIYADKEIFYSIYKKYQNKTLDIRERYKKKIEQIDKAILDINNNLDKMYMDKLRGVLQEEDYIRVSQKFNFERITLCEQKKELEEKLIGFDNKIESKNHTKEEKELDELIENFLKLEKIDKIYLFRLINKIEIDKDKNVYIYFNFSKLDSINENLNKFIKIEELINENQKRKVV
ncbi:MAG TPA: recombinase family protein [Candidatus Scatovivens faecipullorum]|nr:recombinase family protein [Candidatus Scatovivens faecipullorum]